MNDNPILSFLLGATLAMLWFWLAQSVGDLGRIADALESQPPVCVEVSP